MGSPGWLIDLHMQHVRVSIIRYSGGNWNAAKMLLDHPADSIIEVVDVVHPKHKIVCIFGWSSCYNCKEDGAPSSERKKMSVGFGGGREGGWEKRICLLASMDAVMLHDVTPLLKAGALQHLVFQPDDDPAFYALHLAKEQYVGKFEELPRVLWNRQVW